MDYEKLINRLNGLYTALNFQQENRECNKVLAELERMKKIMRENGIMVIPSKYPGGQAEWNIPKP